MLFRNTNTTYGILSVALHWILAVTVVALFVMGLWMVELNYYDPWYKRAPSLHKSVGMLLFMLGLFSLCWRLANPRPKPAPATKPFERKLANVAHLSLYVLVFAVSLSGYLISTADGRPVEIFELFSIPAFVSGIANQEDIAGEAHLTLAVVLVVVAALHALAALKHHFIDKDRTLKRMLGVSRYGRTW